MQYLSEASLRLDREIMSLDLPMALAREAEREYRRIADWLVASGSDLAEYEVNLYPQGSFRLGTPVRPIAHRDEFDIDLVCQLGIPKERTTQEELKKAVGKRLEADPSPGGILKERRRCWTLFYKNKYHLDVLPTIPDTAHGGTGVLVTDTELFRWQFSNPLGYAAWFYDRMRSLVEEERRALAQASNVNIEDIPTWSVRTPLQRTVQVLKRHRDVYFQNDLNLRPVSVIVTTLAAQSHHNEQDLARALIAIIEGMDEHIEVRNGAWWVPNPAHPGENFADKWNEKPAFRDAFLRWRDQAHEDIEHLAHAASQRDVTLLLEKSLHGRLVTSPVVAATSVVANAPSSTIPDVGSLTHREQPQWPSNEIYECSVSSTVFRPSGAGRPRFGVPKAPKHSKLEFHAKTNAPPPYEIFWQITNTGEEARRANSLRGGFEPGLGTRGESKKESTLYYGTHIAQAFVVKDGWLVARSREVRVRIEKS